MKLRVALALFAVCIVIGAFAGFVLSRLTTLDPFALDAHQLDVIRTMCGVIGAFGGVLTVINLVYSILTKRYAKRTYENTSTEDWAGGDLVRSSMAESVRHVRIAAEATRQETADLAGWVKKGLGVHREPTRDIPRLPGGSHYE